MKKSDAVHHDIYDSSEAIKKYIKQFLSANPQLIKDTPDVVKDLPFVSQSPEIFEDQLLEQVDLDKLQKTMPTKSEDDWGVATPDNIQRQHCKKFQISGEGFLGQYTPLFTSKLEEKLLNDPQYMKSIEHEVLMLSKAKKNLNKYLDSLRWLETIYKTCKYWTSESLSSFKNLPPQDIEQRLGELNAWGKKVREMDVTFITKNQLFSVDSIEIYDYLIPRLDSIYQQLLNYVLTESMNNSVLFCEKIHQMAKVLEGKPVDVKDFAEYVHIYKNSKISI
ncbi:DNAH [Acanthosepion pharaonis]|uniref:DNAH n=1 Tax=Acanthosepion pharaonis TaxID=158019 RepID=A0A812E8M6_ACAPH|nr:DNAH [Sepia pharaonis]